LANRPEPVPTGYGVRAASIHDLPAIDELYRESEVALGVLPESRTSYLRWRWAQPYVDMSRDTRVLLHADRLAAFAMTHRDETRGPLISMGRTHPADRGRGIGTWLLAHAEHEARERGAPAVRTAIPREDTAAAGLLAARGYRRVRISYDMGRALDGAERPAPPPDGVAIRPFVRGRDERDTWRIESEAFRDHWDHEGEVSFETWETEWFGDPDATTGILLAEADGRPVGEIAWEIVTGGAYIMSVAVLASHRRRGIAESLMRCAVAEIAHGGHRDVYLSVDADNPTGAVGVYERAGLTVRRTTYVFDKDVGG
jgi:mycothiol synthase